MDNDRRVEFCVVSGVLKGGDNPDSPLSSLHNGSNVTGGTASGLDVQFSESQAQFSNSLTHSLAVSKAAAIKTEADEAA